MIQIAIEDVKDRGMLAYMSDDDKSDFIVYRVYRCVDSNHDLRAYQAVQGAGRIKPGINYEDFLTMEEDIRVGYKLLWKEYVRRVSVDVSAQAYGKHENDEHKDPQDIALDFYYGLMRCSFKAKLDALLEAILFVISDDSSDENVTS